VASGSRPEGPSSLESWARVEALTEAPDLGPYHLEPSLWQRDVLGVPSTSRSTWSVLTDIIGCDKDRFDDACYQVERSVVVARTRDKGAVPVAAREEFLIALVTAMRHTATVLLLHGEPRWDPLPPADDDTWAMVNWRLTTAFLGADIAGEIISIGKQRVRVFRTPTHLVLWMWAPGARLTGGYVEKLSDLVAATPATSD